jgi:hypothetical protein
VILRTAPPGVVRDFVVVPCRDQGMPRMHRDRVRIGLVLRVPPPVFVECRNLTRRLGNPAKPFRMLGGVIAHAVLVNVVAEVNNGVEIVLQRDIAIHVEIARRMV